MTIVIVCPIAVNWAEQERHVRIFFTAFILVPRIMKNDLLTGLDVQRVLCADGEILLKIFVKSTSRQSCRF